MVWTSLWWTRNTIVELLSYQVWATNQPCEMVLMTFVLIVKLLIFMWQCWWQYVSIGNSPCSPASSPSRPSWPIELEGSNIQHRFKFQRSDMWKTCGPPVWWRTSAPGRSWSPSHCWPLWHYVTRCVVSQNVLHLLQMSVRIESFLYLQPTNLSNRAHPKDPDKNWSQCQCWTLWLWWWRGGRRTQSHLLGGWLWR